MAAIHPREVKYIIYIRCLDRGGEGGIRTPGTLARTPHFECGAIDHSATSPRGRASEALSLGAGSARRLAWRGPARKAIEGAMPRRGRPSGAAPADRPLADRGRKGKWSAARRRGRASAPSYRGRRLHWG